jgi:hypothetical protein
MIINIQELNVFQGNVDVYKTSNSGDIQKVDAVAASTMDSLPLNDEHVVSEFAGNSKAEKYVNDGAKSAKAGAKASKASETTSTSSTTTTYDCGGSCLCVAGDLRVSLLSDPEPNLIEVRDLKVGDSIQGLDANMNLAVCKVEAVSQVGWGPVYQHYTANHFILDTAKRVVHPNGATGEMEVVDIHVVLTSCPVGLDEFGVAFTPIDGEFVGSEPIAWTNYLPLHQGIVDIVHEVGPLALSPSEYTATEDASPYAEQLCKTSLSCVVNAETCGEFKTAALGVAENASFTNAENSFRSAAFILSAICK